MESIAISHGLLVSIVSIAVGWLIAIVTIAVYQDRFPRIKKAVYCGVIISALLFMIVFMAREKSLSSAISVVVGLTLGEMIRIVRRARHRKGQPRTNDQQPA